MKVTIDNSRGVVTVGVGRGFFQEGTWDDLVAEIIEVPESGLVFEEYRDTGYFMRFFRSDVDRSLFMTYQMPHGWDKKTIHPHMHVVPMTTGSGNVITNYSYAWSQANDGQIPAGSGWVTGSVTTSFISTDGYVQKVIGFGYLDPPEGASESIVLLFKVERRASDPGDTYKLGKDHGTPPGNLAILFCDLHYKNEKLGTINEFPEF